MASTPPVPRLKKMVELMLDENPKWRGVEVRNSDIALTIVIWQRWYNVSDKEDGVVHLYRLMDLPREDNVKRIRAVFQNVEHRFLPTNPDVLIKRGIEAEYWAEALGYRLTPEEWKLHHKTVAETKPPKIYIDEATDMSESALDQLAKMTPKDIKAIGERQQLARDLEKPLAALQAAQGTHYHAKGIELVALDLEIV